MVPGMWMNEYVLLVQRIKAGWARNQRCTAGSTKRPSRCSAWITCIACSRAVSTVEACRVTAVKARPSW